jgi:hypothetical protein
LNAAPQDGTLADQIETGISIVTKLARLRVTSAS